MGFEKLLGVSGPKEKYDKTQWIADNLAAEDIEFVTHMGDVVHTNTSEQWSAATAA